MSGGVHARAERTCHSEMSQKKPQIENVTVGCEWRHAPEAWAEIWAKVSWLSFTVGRRMLTFACSPKPSQWPCGRCCTWFGADGKVSIERGYLTPYVEKPLNSKVIKSFVPELRSRKCFFFLCVFRDSYVINMCVMNILCTFHIFMYGYVTFMLNGISRTYQNDDQINIYYCCSKRIACIFVENIS